MRDWFVVNTGYVRQLATSFYNELTVRENLLFSMNMQAQSRDSLKMKLRRVEQVIREMGLEDQADIVVGDGIGLGLSGGQVRMGMEIYNVMLMLAVGDYKFVADCSLFRVMWTLFYNLHDDLDNKSYTLSPLNYIK